MSAQALVATGKDCDCGHPLVWRYNEPWCSVYGSHPVVPGRADREAPGAELVRLVTSYTHLRRAS